MYIRKSTKVGFDGESGRVDLDIVISNSYNSSDSSIAIRFVVALKEYQFNELFLLPDAKKKRQTKRQCVHYPK